MDIARDIPWNTSGQLLVVGNPPWVTNSEQGALNGNNLPQKTNLKNLRGIDAMTGKSNFDIAEFIWIKLLHDLSDAQATIALLCKTSVARSVLTYARQMRLPISGGRLYRINAKKWFDAAVDACLFAVGLNQSTPDYQARVFEHLSDKSPQSSMGFVNHQLVTHFELYQEVAFIEGTSPVEWRQGLKHDAASVMELHRQEDIWLNNSGEPVDVEDEFIYPLVKSSDIKGNGKPGLQRGVIVPQQQTGQATAPLEALAPRLWKYLTTHADIFAARKSSIYRNQPPFSIFGIGEYSFAPYKVVVSGFYKTPWFVPLLPVNQRPVMCDDTCYLLPFDSLWKAALVAALNHPRTRQFLRCVAFTDSKRPVTKSVLNRMNLKTLIARLPMSELMDGVQQFSHILPLDVTHLPESGEAISGLLFPGSKQLSLL